MTTVAAAGLTEQDMTRLKEVNASPAESLQTIAREANGSTRLTINGETRNASMEELAKYHDADPETVELARGYDVASAIYHTFRRPHKLGWIRTYAIWITNGLYLVLKGDSAFKEWKVVR